MRIIIISLLTLLWFSGCTMIPNYQRPEAPMPEKFPEGAAAEAVSEVGAAAAELPWREFI